MSSEGKVNLQKDPGMPYTLPTLPLVTGEMVSKSEMKKRLKLREREAKKAASAPPPPAKEIADKVPDEESLDPSQYFENRSKIIQKLRQTQDPNPYPYKFHVSMSLPAFIKKYTSTTKDGEKLPDTVSLAGRLHNMRSSGAKLKFYGMFCSSTLYQSCTRRVSRFRLWLL